MDDTISLQKRATDEREKGNFAEVLRLTDEAMLAFQKEGNVVGITDILSSRFLALRHLFEQTGDKNFMILAKHTVMSALEIARKSEDKKALATPLFNMGKAHETLEEYEKAVEAYKDAIAHFTQNPRVDHPGEIYEMLIHLSFAEYKTGDKSALSRLEKAIEDLASTDEEKYEKDVWMSGGYMEIAEMLKDDDPNKAALALDKAKEIIDANPDLTLRKKQFEKLSAIFNN